MIAWLVYKLLPLLYDIDNQGFASFGFMVFSAVELFFEIGGFIGFCIIDLPGIVKKWRYRNDC